VIAHESANKIYVNTNTYSVGGDALFARSIMLGTSILVALYTV
jgi:hypothetical protein